MRYAKLIDGNLAEMQTIFLENGGVIYNPTDKQFVDNGFKPFIEGEIPAIGINEYIISNYEETDTEITASYTVMSYPAPDVEPLEPYFNVN